MRPADETQWWQARQGRQGQTFRRPWGTYVPRNDFITQRGGTFLIDADDSLLYSHRDPGILGFSATMNRPLSFLDPFLKRST